MSGKDSEANAPAREIRIKPVHTMIAIKAKA
jgi:hypothetical protein